MTFPQALSTNSCMVNSSILFKKNSASSLLTSPFLSLSKVTRVCNSAIDTVPLPSESNSLKYSWASSCAISFSSSWASASPSGCGSGSGGLYFSKAAVSRSSAVFLTTSLSFLVRSASSKSALSLESLLW